jgi:hypothetical protein
MTRRRKEMLYYAILFGTLAALLGLEIMAVGAEKPIKTPGFVLRACGAGYVMTNAGHTVRWLHPERGDDMALAADADIHGLCDDTVANSLARR